jgi:NTP pyrophosphatase (non-canonical NTP hydrolase)
MADDTTPVAALKDIARRFAAARNWEPYHSPKNLVMALACEVAELMEPFRWLTADESRAALADPATREAVADELSDVTYLVMLVSLHTGIDITDAVRAKMAKNEQKYPAPAADPGPGG